MRILLIDDKRNWQDLVDLGFLLFPDTHRVLARSYKVGIKYLKEEKWDILFLDHDLGCKKTGYDILCWLEEHSEFIPANMYFVSSNPVGVQRMQQVKERLYRKET